MFLDRLSPTLARASTDDAHELAWVFLANAAEPTVRTVLTATASQPLNVREKFGEAIKGDLEAQDKARQDMIDLGVPLAPAEPGAQRWQRYAPLLGVTP